MASKSRKLRAAIKAILEPALKEAGFAVAYPNFRRIDGDTIDLVHLQYSKWGGAFILNMGRQIGPLEHPWHGVVPPHELEVVHLPMEKQQRLGPVRTAKRDHMGGWFKYQDIWDDRAALDRLMQEVVGLLPQMEAWLKDGTRGPNVDPENAPFSWEGTEN